MVGRPQTLLFNTAPRLGALLSPFPFSPACRSRGSHPILRCKPQTARHYGTQARQGRGSERREGSDNSWPTCPNPTPYDILDIRKDACYDKARFYELVKTYHPDRLHHSRISNISRTTRLDRYHLIILANDILCDPSKRHAYDLYGAGWTSQRPNDTAWQDRSDSAARNATWEDWEKWYNRRSGRPASPVYMSNSSFAALVLLFIAIGGIGQLSRADARSANFERLKQQQQDDIANALTRRSAAASGLSKEERVESFIRDRENALYGYTPSAYDSGDGSTPTK